MISVCNLCGADGTRLLFTQRGWRLETCAGCGLVRVDPMPTSDQLAQMYGPAQGYQLGRLTGATRYTRWERRRAAWLADITGGPPRPDARLLDVGCSTGDFLECAQARGWTAQGIELARHLAIFAKVKRGLSVEPFAVGDIAQRFAPASFSAITLWDVIEHLPKPLEAMRDLYGILEPGGRIYFSTPNLDGWVPRFHWSCLRPLTGMWPHPEPPAHLHQFSRETIARLIAAAGFDRIRFRPDAIPLWYTAGFQGEPQLRHWLGGEPGVRWPRTIYLATAPVYLAARLCGRGDSIVVSASRS